MINTKPKRETFRIIALRRWESLIQSQYSKFGMQNMMALPANDRLKFWSGGIKVLGLGYALAMVSNGLMACIALFGMNAVLIWWFWTWKRYLHQI